MYFHYLKKTPGETIKATPSLLVIITLQAITMVTIAWKKMKATLLLFSGALLFIGAVLYLAYDLLPIVLAA